MIPQQYVWLAWSSAFLIPWALLYWAFPAHRRAMLWAAVFTAQSWMLLAKIACDDSLLPIDHWTAVERTHYMESSKLFVPVDRPFWQDKDPRTGREPLYHVGLDDAPEWEYRGEALAPLKGYPGVLMARPKRKSKILDELDNFCV